MTLGWDYGILGLVYAFYSGTMASRWRHGFLRLDYAFFVG